jgi:hypothetical protein
MKKIVLLFLIVTCIPTQTFSQCETPPTGMISWWTGDMTSLDKIDDNHAIPFNGVTYAAGMVDETFLFDGIDDVAIVFPSPELDTTGDMTAMAWVRRIGYASDEQVVFCKGSGAVPNDAPIVFALRFRFNLTEFIFRDTLGNTIIVNGPAFEDSMYHHYVYVRQGNWHGVYVDGFLFDNGTFVNPPASSAGLSFTLGAQYHNPTSGPNDFDFHFHGELDELMLFNRALTVTEIQAIYNAGTDGVCKDALSIAEHTQEVGVKVFPNPSSDYVQFQLNEIYLQQYTNATLSIFDMKGATIKETRMEFNSPIDISNLKNGAYFYTITHKSKVLKSGQIMKK